MKRAIIILSTVALASCEQQSQYQCSCDVYGKMHGTVPRGQVERYDIATKDEAITKCNALTEKYKAKYADSVDKDSWAECTFSEVNYGQK